MASQKFIWSTLLTQAYPTDIEGVGKVRWQDDKAYRWVGNTQTNTSLTAGNLCCHDFTFGTTAMSWVKPVATALLGFLAGIPMATLNSNTGTNPLIYGWVQIWGINTAVSVTPVNTQTTANPVAGNALIGVNGATYATSGAAMGTAPVYTRSLQLLDSVAGSTAVQVCNVFVRCLQ